ncbi:MAG TPA: hypothetical protein VK653_18295 [Xanthobacteraceae bacterium]|nr:hypothetical protein [Xanthobacteraceae bacterium]
MIDLVSCEVKPCASNMTVIANGFLSLGNKPLNSQVTGTQTHAILQSVVQAIEARAFGRAIGDTRVTAKKAILVLLLLASATTAVFANAPGGSYIQCDPKNPRSPVRCTPDGW